MGNDCLSTTPNQYYSQYLKEVNIGQLKDLWETVKLYKIKKIFDKVAQPHPDHSHRTHLSYENFKEIFPEFKSYDELQIKRIFQIFDQDSQGFLDWNSFFSSISICYFGNERTLSLFMFMIFDSSLEKKLSLTEIRQLVLSNKNYLKQSQFEEGALLYEPQQVIQKLTKNSELTVDHWLDESINYFDFARYRRLFNIFKEERLQKQLVKHFSKWNTIYDEDKQKYISYLVSLKWFQSWKLYVQEHYNQTINIYSTQKSTIKTIKTFAKTNRKITYKGKIDSIKKFRQDFREIEVKYQKLHQENGQDFNIKNFNFIQSNIGERPRQIYNNFLEGQFEQVLKPGITQNMDYVLVSEKIWNNLKAIYQGSPQFRRTGYDTIELYPKIIKIYSSFFKNQIDYSTEVIRQVSAYLQIDHLLQHSLDLSEINLKNKSVFYKTIGMPHWDEIQDLTYQFTELSPQIIIFMIYIDKSQSQNFKKNYQKRPKEVNEVNVGDYLVYKDPKTKAEKQVIFMGKSTEGKFIIHFHKQSYIYDVCLLQSQLVRNCRLSSVLVQLESNQKQHTELIGLPNVRGASFINSFILHLLSNKQFKTQIAQTNQQYQDKMVHTLFSIQQMLNQHKKVQSNNILDLVEIFLPKYQNFDVSMCYDFANDFLTKISTELNIYKIKDTISQSFGSKWKRTMNCKKCLKQTFSEQQKLLLSIPIPQAKDYYYEVVFIPVSQGDKNGKIKRYGFKLKGTATLQQYMNQFQRVSGNIGKYYILAQVYSNNIIKNYQSVNKSATLQQLKLRDSDTIFAYELYANFKNFIAEHYNLKEQISDTDIKKDQFIDCKHKQKGWIFGKITQIQYLPYTQTTLVKVIHKFTKNESWEITYDAFEGSIAKFPLKSYKNCEQYHLRLQQRYFNEASNQMQLCNIPLVVVLTNWMRWRQFFYHIYLQIQKFISDDYAFHANVQEKQNQIRLNKDRKTMKKRIQQNKLEQFKQYKKGKKFPYKLNLVDFQGRCAICFKFLKSVVFKGENEIYCEGCPLSQSQPITWQVKPADLMICIDWKSTAAFKKDIIQNDDIIKKLQLSKGIQKESLSNYLNHTFEKFEVEDSAICCNYLSPKTTSLQILKYPDSLILYLQRIVEQEDGFKKIIQKHIDFSLNNLKMGDSLYDLIGVTSIEGNNRNIGHKTFILKAKNQWYEYDGLIVRVVDDKFIQKLCAFCLYYKKKTN